MASQYAAPFVPRWFPVAALAGLLWLVAGTLLQADVITLQDGSSTFTLVPTSSAGATSWTVGGTNYLNQQGYWYLIGDSGVAQPVFTLGSLTETLFDGTTGASVGYGSAGGLEAILKYSLLGGDGSSNLSEQVKLTNAASSIMTVHLFQYTDANLGAGPDMVQFVNGSDVRQSSSAGMMESLVTGSPAAHEAGLVPTTLNKLNTVSGLTLDSAQNGPLTGNATFAYQWNATLQPGHSVTFGQNNSVNVTSPEPGSLSLLAVAAIGFGLAACARRRSRAARRAAIAMDEAGVIAFPPGNCARASDGARIAA